LVWLLLQDFTHRGEDFVEFILTHFLQSVKRRLLIKVKSLLLQSIIHFLVFLGINIFIFPLLTIQEAITQSRHGMQNKHIVQAVDLLAAKIILILGTVARTKKLLVHIVIQELADLFDLI